MEESKLHMKLSGIFLNRFSPVMRLYKRDQALFVTEWNDNTELVKEISPEEYLTLIQSGQVKYVGAYKPIYDALEQHFKGDTVLIEEPDKCEICHKIHCVPTCYVDCPTPQYIYILMGDRQKYMQQVKRILKQHPDYKREKLIQANAWEWEQTYLIRLKIADLLRKDFRAIQRIPLIAPPTKQYYNDVGKLIGETVLGSYRAKGVDQEIMEEIDNQIWFCDFMSKVREEQI